MPIDLHVIYRYATFVLPKQSQIIAIETRGPTKAKLFTIWTFTKHVCLSLAHSDAGAVGLCSFFRGRLWGRGSLISQSLLPCQLRDLFALRDSLCFYSLSPITLEKVIT